MSEPSKAALADRFFDCLASQGPESVLDVGCGLGRLLRQCGDAGIPARGVEPDSDKRARLAAAGLDCVEGRAEELPIEDGAFDWVTLRHVPHHLADERPALAEAFRVARSGVLVAEPWLDLSIASQRVARAFDAWLEEQHTRVGQVHRIPRSAGDILGALPEGLEVEVDIVHHLLLRPRPEGWLRDEAAPFLTGPDLGDAAQREFEAIETAAADDGLTCNGSAIWTLRRRKHDVDSGIRTGQPGA